MRQFETFALFGWHRIPCSKGIFQRPKHQREGRPKFMTDVGKERRFCSVQFGECFRTLAFFSVGPCIVDVRGQISCARFKEISIRSIQLAVRAYSYSHHSDGFSGWAQDRNRNRPFTLVSKRGSGKRLSISHRENPSSPGLQGLPDRPQVLIR